MHPQVHPRVTDQRCPRVSRCDDIPFGVGERHGSGHGEAFSGVTGREGFVLRAVNRVEMDIELAGPLAIEEFLETHIDELGKCHGLSHVQRTFLHIRIIPDGTGNEEGSGHGQTYRIIPLADEFEETGLTGIAVCGGTVQDAPVKIVLVLRLGGMEQRALEQDDQKNGTQPVRDRRCFLPGS